MVTYHVIPELGQSGVDRPLFFEEWGDRPLFEESHGMFRKIPEKTSLHFYRDKCLLPLLINFFLTIYLIL